MAIIIKKKKALSNKPETPPKIEDEAIKSASPAPSSSKPTHTLFIDRISIIVSIPENLAFDAFTSLLVQTQDLQLFKPANPSGGFNRAWRIAINCAPNSEKWPIFMASWDKTAGKALKWRLEFSPVDLGLDGLQELHAALLTVVDNGWRTFIEFGRISMIEISLDLEGVTVEQFNAIPTQAVFRQVWGKDGLMETIVLGKPRGNQTKIYNRGKKRQDKGQTWTGPVTTRVERRLLPSGLAMSKLSGISNAFSSVIVPKLSIPAPPSEPASKAYLWTLFQDSAKVRGVAGALNLLPEVKKATYRLWLKQNPVAWWAPEAIWTEWPNYLDELKFCDKDAW